MHDEDERPGETRFGAVIVFKEGMTRAQAELIVDTLARKGLISETRPRAFDPNWGGPVWYIP